MTVLPYIFITVLQLLIIYSLMLAFRFLIKTILKSKSVQSRVLFYFNVFCYFIWIVFVLIKVSDSIGENSLFVAPVLLLLLVLMWDYLKNFFLGIIFSFQYGFLEGSYIVINNKQGKITAFSSSYFEILTGSGKRVKIKFKEVYNGRFEVFRGELNRIFRKIKLDTIENPSELKAKIMNHPLFLYNSTYKFSEEIDDNGTVWFSFYFNVFNYKEAKEINSFLNQILRTPV